MSAISIETKKATDLAAIETIADDNLVLVHDGAGLKKMTFANFKAKTVEGTEDKIAPCFSIMQERITQSIVVNRSVHL